MELSGVDESQWRHLQQGAPLTEDEQEVTLKVLYRVRNFDPVNIAQWTQHELPLDKLAHDPQQFQGQMFALHGRVEGVDVEHPPKEVVARLEMDRYFVCRVKLEGGQTALILTTRIPRAWPLERPLDERVSATGLLLKLGATDQGEPQWVFAAPRLAWHPDTVRSGSERPATNLGMTVLGDMGMDVGLLDDVANGQGIGEREREPFYRMLAAMDHAQTAQLERFALLNLVDLRQAWQREVDELGEKIQTLQRDVAPPGQAGQPVEGNGDGAELKRLTSRRAVLRKALEEAAQQRFSVFPLFNQSAEQSGQLVMLEGEARRALEVRVVAAQDGQANSDVVRRFGIDRYYEVEMFTRDSQNNPVVFCVRELPEGFPLGDDIHEPVRIAGFFFKSWAYYTDKSLVAPGASPQRKQQQLAPLLIGRAPTWIAKEASSPNPYIGLAAGGLFVVALLLIWYSLWRISRGDRAFHAENVAKRLTSDENVPLDDFDMDFHIEPAPETPE